MAKIQRTFLNENVPLVRVPHGRSAWVGGPSYQGAGNAGRNNLIEFAIDLSIARTLDGSGANAPLLLNVAGNLVAFTESYDTTPTPNPDAVMQVNPDLDQTNPQNFFTVRPGRGLENFPFTKLWIINPAQPANNKALIVVVSNAQFLSDLLTNG
jgi:hypothetical protein